MKNNGDISDSFSTARRDTETMLNTCLPKSKVRSCHKWKRKMKEKKSNEIDSLNNYKYNLLQFIPSTLNLTVPITVCGRENL